MLGFTSRLRHLYHSHISKPAEWRPLCRQVLDSGLLRIMELGLGRGDRARRLIELARLASPDATVCYTGIDLFEARTAADGPGLSLKLAHRDLNATGAKVRLVPGDPLTALARTANSLGGQDMVLIAADQQRESLDRAWFYLPRVLAKGATVWMESNAAGQISWQQISDAEVHERAGRGTRRVA